ncbi:MAG TPA: nucleoside 5-triphosphatase RdgB (dHAPTP, dITP,XTP-specific), partial [Porphyromonadaceae bacterium]|nr:nucleoside 5-triphosphatase RdgB (dHAPTP, dITP,XTP-specific) [Porphyromonadaceae bacterium]
VNASFYDIKEYFQGRNEKGKMNSKSEDSHYMELIKTLRESIKTLGDKIAKKVYQYGFLK